jgi:hypothetical protein
MVFVVEQTCRNPTLKKYEDETYTLEMGTWESSETPETSEFDCRDQNTHIGVFFISLENYQNAYV